MDVSILFCILALGKWREIRILSAVVYHMADIECNHLKIKILMSCRYCQNGCVKSGIRNGTQRYRCKFCKKYQQENYTKPRIPQEKYEWTVRLNNEGCGISNIARLLEISKSSVQRLIERKNLTLRTLLKRLARKTLCFTRAAEMLENVVFLLVFRQRI